MTTVALFFLAPALGGGSTSFTVHLFEGFRRADIPVKIYRIKAREEHFERPFGKYENVTYRNVTSEEAISIVRSGPSLLTAPAHSKHLPWAPDIITRLMWFGMRIVVHDPNEFKIYDHFTTLVKKSARPFCIRPTMYKFFPKAIYICHPYVRQFSTEVYEETKRPLNAVSVARISFVKRTELILEANRLLSRTKRIILRGAENRLYTRHVLTKKFPEFKQGGYGFPMTWGAAAIECAKAKYAVDLTYFPDDGGGSQYSFMEAWDGGAVNIIHEDWTRYPGEMRPPFNCLAIHSPRDLVNLLSGKYLYADIASHGYRQLQQHDACEIAKEYMMELLH